MNRVGYSAENHQPPLRTGALTLLLTAVLICLALLSVLSLTTAQADARLAEKQLENLQTVADAEQTGQQWLAQVDAALHGAGDWPESAQRSGNEVTAQLPVAEGGTLYIALRIDGQSYAVTRWQLERPWQAEESWQLWDGM